MHRVVLDTNILVSASLHPAGSKPDQVVRAWLAKRYALALSPALVDEYQRVLFRDRIRALSRWTEEEARDLIGQIAHSADIQVPGTMQIAASRDPADDKFLIAAAEASADFLVTGDLDLLSLETFRETQIVTPSKFLKEL